MSWQLTVASKAACRQSDNTQDWSGLEIEAFDNAVNISATRTCIDLDGQHLTGQTDCAITTDHRFRADDARRRAGAVADSSGAGTRRRRARSPARPTLNSTKPLMSAARTQHAEVGSFAELARR